MSEPEFSDADIDEWFGDEPPDEPQWTTTPPTEPGWYFWKPLEVSVVATPTKIPLYKTEQAPWGRSKVPVPTTGYWWPVELSKLAGIDEPK